MLLTEDLGYRFSSPRGFGLVTNISATIWTYIWTYKKGRSAFHHHGKTLGHPHAIGKVIFDDVQWLDFVLGWNDLGQRQFSRQTDDSRSRQACDIIGIPGDICKRHRLLRSVPERPTVWFSTAWTSQQEMRTPYSLHSGTNDHQPSRLVDVHQGSVSSKPFLYHIYIIKIQIDNKYLPF